MKMRAGRTQAMTKAITPNSDCSSRRGMWSMWCSERQCWSSSWRRSGVTDNIMACVSIAMLRNVIEVESGQSLSGDDCKLSAENKASSE